MEMAKVCSFGVQMVMAMLIVSAISSNLGVGNVEAITCQDAVISLMPCVPFLTTPVEQPGSVCCLAVARLNEKADSTQARRSLCECFKTAAPSLGVDFNKAKQLPDLCNVKTPVPIDPSIDCNSIQEVYGGYF